MKNLKKYKCPCSKKEHTVDLNKEVWDLFAKMVKQYGDASRVHSLTTNKVYLIPKIYIAVHGIQGATFHLLGFPTVERKDNSPHDPHKE